MIAFSFIQEAEPIRGRLVYVPGDYSFDFEQDAAAGYDFLKRAGVGSTPLVIDHYLQMEVSVETGFLLYVHGLHGHQRWKQGLLPTIQSITGIVRAHFDRPVTAAVGVALIPPDTWTTIYDSASGCVYIGPEAIPAANQYIEFADNTVAALASDRLVSLWLWPQITSPIKLDAQGRI